MTDAEGWYRVLTPSDPTTALNEVVACRAEAERADVAIDRVIAEHEAAGAPLKWVEWPEGLDRGGGIPGLAGRLEERGFRSWEARALALGLAGRQGSATPGVEPVGVDQLEAWAAVLSAGWGQPVEGVRLDCRRALADPRRGAFLAYVEGQPVGTAGYVLSERSAYLTGAVVLPEFRGRGLYRALIEARLEAARAAGRALATTHARPTSAPLLERLGFEVLARYRCWANDAPEG